MANILVTGASGFVGKHVLKWILKENNVPIAMVQDHNRKFDNELMSKVRLKGAEVVGSILDKDFVRRVVNQYELDYVIHLAAMPIVKNCDSDPWTAYQTNAVGTLNLVEAIRNEMQRNTRIKKIICMSTDKVYGSSSPDGGYLENTPFDVSDSYCVSKACGDMISRSYANTYNLPVVTVRCGNLYGSMDLNLSRLIPGTILRLLNGQNPVLYSDAKQMKREFIHVEDVVSAYSILLKEGKNGEAYNVGTSSCFKIGDVIQSIINKINPKLFPTIIERNLFEINEQSLNSSKLQKLGWKQEISLDQGLDEAILWYKRWWEKTTKNSLY